MFPYSMIFAKLGLGLLALILQINLLGKRNLARRRLWIRYRITFSAALSAASFITTRLVFFSFS